MSLKLYSLSAVAVPGARYPVGPGCEMNPDLLLDSLLWAPGDSHGYPASSWWARSILEVGQDAPLVVYFKDSSSIPCILENFCYLN